MEDRRLLISLLYLPFLQALLCRTPFSKFLSFASVPFPVIKLELIGVASNLDPVPVRIEKADGAVASDFQVFRTAYDGNFSPSQHGIKLVHLLVRADIDAEMMEFRCSLPSHVLLALRELHQSNVMVFSAEAHKGHLRAPVPGRNLHADNRAIEVLRFFQVGHVENYVSQDSITYSHRKALIRKPPEPCQGDEAPKRNGVLERPRGDWRDPVMECWSNGMSC
jgi:hypothetical protein